MQDKTIKTPSRGPMGRMGRNVGESAKDFKGAIKRLFSELKSYRVFDYDCNNSSNIKFSTLNICTK